MRPSLEDFPSSPSSAWSCTGSRSPCSPSQELSPLTPDSCFPPGPAVFSPDDYSLRIDRVLDEPHSIAHPPVPPPKTDSRILSEDDLSNLRLLMRNRGRWVDMYDRFESSPPRPLNAHCTLLTSQDGPTDGLSWEATRPGPADSNELLDASRCSILIREVSLLVGLSAEDVRLPPGNDRPHVPDESRQASGVLPLNLNPTKSLASRKRRNANIPNHPSPGSSPQADNSNLGLRREKPPLGTSADIVKPIARHKSVDAIRPSLSARRRQGQIFDLEPSLSNASCQNAIHLDDAFIHPRDPPPKPTSIPPPNRYSSLERLECSLRKLEAYAPRNHRKSQSEGQPLSYVARPSDKRPSLPPPRHLKKQQSIPEIMLRNSPRTAHGYHPSAPLPPASRPTPLPRLVIPRTCPVAPVYEHHEGDVTPGSFMDMDIPRVEEGSHIRQTSLKRKQKMKGLVNAAKRVSRGVMTWGKNLTGSTKPLREAIAL